MIYPHSCCSVPIKHNSAPNAGSSCCPSLASGVPYRIAHDLHLARSAGEKVLHRYRIPRLSHLWQTALLPVHRSHTRPLRTQSRGPLCTWTLGNLGVFRTPTVTKEVCEPPGAQSQTGSGNRESGHVHHEVDDHSRLVYSEIPNGGKSPPPASSPGGEAFNQSRGIVELQVSACYGFVLRFNASVQPLRQGIEHNRLWNAFTTFVRVAPGGLRRDHPNTSLATIEGHRRYAPAGRAQVYDPRALFWPPIRPPWQHFYI